MALNRRGIIIEIIGDVKSYLTGAESVISTNTKLNSSFKETGISADLSAKAQVAASLKMEAAQTRNIAALRALSVSPGASRTEQAAAARLATEQETRLARAMGVSAVAGGRLSSSAREGERDLGKLARGALAGSGAAAALGRSLAFASTGFIAITAGATLVRSSIDAARALAVAERQVGRQLRTANQSWASNRTAVEQNLLALSHLSGFTRVDLLQSFGFFVRATDSVSKSLRLDAIAADVARGRHISLQAATLALSKAYGGSVSALRRLGIEVPKNVKGWEAINFVAGKFAGQALAGTTAADRLNATWTDSKEIIGTALLPTLNRYLTGLGNWLTKMNESGRLQKDVNTTVRDAIRFVKDLTEPIRILDKVTGGFANTLKILAAIKFASMIAGWVTDLELLASRWGLVATAAETAGAAQATALGGGAAGAGARAARGGITAGEVGAAAGGVGVSAALARLFGRGGGTSDVAKRIGLYTGATRSAATEISRTSQAFQRFSRVAKILVLIRLISDPKVSGGVEAAVKDFFHGQVLPAVQKGAASAAQAARDVGLLPPSHPSVLIPTIDRRGVLHERFAPTPLGPVTPRSTLPLPGFGPPGAFFPSSQGPSGPFGAARPMTQFFKQFQLGFAEQLAQVQASLTRSSADDVAAARKIVARIKTLVDEGRLHGAALVQAIGLEASALSTIWSAEDAAAQKRAAAIQKAKDAQQARIQNAIDPLKLEVALSRAQATGADQKQTLAILRAERAAAWNAIHSFHLTGQNLRDAYDRITSLNQQIKDQIQSGQKSFIEPIRLQIALAREQALGLSDTATLRKMKAAAMKAIRSGKFTGQALVDLWNQIANINGQLSSSATSALGLFKQANIDQIVKSTGLTGAKARALKAQLSQLGPGGKIPGTGVGAAGFAINPATGQPIILHSTVTIDGKVVGTAVTKHQQQHRRRNPTQRRGPNAAVIG